MSRLITGVAVVVAFVIAACSKTDPGPGCPEIVDHMLLAMKTQFSGHGGVEVGNRKAMIETCERRQMPKATRECLMAANDQQAIGDCHAYTRRPPPAAPTAPARVPPPIGSAAAPPPPPQPAPVGGTPTP